MAATFAQLARTSATLGSKRLSMRAVSLPCNRVSAQSFQRTFVSNRPLRNEQPRGAPSTNPTSDPVRAKPAPPTGKTIALEYESYDPPASAEPVCEDAKAVVVCHGLFGSKQNWRSLGKSMTKRLGLPVYALDLRNHGNSSHVDGMSYADMAADVLRFIKEKQLEKVALIGHSMGGKVSLALALSPELPERTLSHLISVDMSPARGPLSKEFEGYVEAMLEIEKRGCETRAAADEVLQDWESELGVRQFLLTNLQRAPPDAKHLSFRIPLAFIKKNLSQIGDFPYDPPGIETASTGAQERKWEGKTLFIKGAKSKYINRRNIPMCEAHFPNMRLETLDAGHWVQAERPNEFVEHVKAFLEG